ncbi:MAG: signal peptidase I [Bacilli bacterium]|nr:signal peptidase I [Bacilli bacterium]
MKKGYKRLLYFESIIFLVLILNSFVWNILNKYTILLFIGIILILFKIFFGFEKDKHRYTKDIIMDTIIFLLIYFMCYYLLGVIISFASSGNHYTIEGFKTFIIPIIIQVILVEYLRYVMMCKSEGNIITMISTILLITLIDTTSAIYYADFTSSYGLFKLIALTILPALSRNIGFSYLVLKTGFKPLIVYQLVMGLYYYLIPIVPNPNEYLSSIILFCVPIIYCYKRNTFFQKTHDREIERDYRKKSIVPLLTSTAIVIIIVVLTSGYFHLWAIAVASGSMAPKINKGDVVIIEKINNNINKLKKGDVIAFKYKDVVVVHRLTNIIVEKDEYYFYTKGDANSHEDSFIVEKDMIVGLVNYKIPFIGLPTVWLNEL